MECKKLVDGFCTHYKKENPPESVCAICKYRETIITIVDHCDKYKYNGDLCYDGVTWRPIGGVVCSDRCGWKGEKENGTE